MRRFNHPTTSWRRAIILIVVLALLALFAVVGLLFVLYAQNSHRSANNFSQAWQLPFRTTSGASVGGGFGGANGAVGQAGGNAGANGNYIPPDVPPLELFKWATGQLIYPVPDDAGGVDSAIRGHELSRTEYGYNDAALNTQPFNGSGRYNNVYNGGSYDQMNDYFLVNYKYAAGFDIRDPERYGSRTKVTDPRGVYVGGANPPVTYPDLNNMALAAARADGTDLMPSLHRHWLFGAMYDTTNPANPYNNPNWTNGQGRFLTLRPRPVDNLQAYPDGRPGFPYPPEPGGDVKNKIGYPGGNDSIWVDLGFPERRAADGRRYKPLFAFRVEDLDNALNLNTAGNLMGGSKPNEDHTSNQGWGKWEASIKRILDRADTPAAAAEWRNLMLGNSLDPAVPSRYGQDRVPSSLANSASGGKVPRFFGQVDFNGSNEFAGFTPTGQLAFLPASPFPIFPQGYGNGAATARQNHALLFDYFRPSFWPYQPETYDSVFPVSDIKYLRVNGYTGSGSMNANVTRLCPLQFTIDPVNNPNALKRRNLVTTLSMSLGRTGMAPWLFGRPAGYMAPADPSQPPSWQPLGNIQADPNGNPLPRYALEAALEAVNLDQVLRPYPHVQKGVPPANYNDRFDGDPAVLQQFVDAQTDRINMAKDIFLRLLLVTGVPAPVDPNAPTDDELTPIRYMAQLAANIVDFIDEDEISTAFNFYPYAYRFYTGTDPNALQLAAFTGTYDDTNPRKEKVPLYWAFGTELPSVLLNEVFTQYELPTDAMGKVMNGPFSVKVWAELHNPFPSSLSATVQQQDQFGVPLYIPKGAAGTNPYASYQVVIANTNAGGPTAKFRDNILGPPHQVRSMLSFSSPVVPTVNDVQNKTGGTVGMAVSPQQGSGFFIAGPLGNTRGNTINNSRVPGDVPWLQTNDMQYTVTYNAGTWTPNDQVAGVTVLLRRLVNPHLPPQDDPSQAFYNPYITVDFIKSIDLNDVTSPGQDKTQAFAIGKKQPYAAERTQQCARQNFDGGLNEHTLGKANDPSQPREWLCHLDRQLVSAWELLNVSGYRPHQLTQKFIVGGVPHSHRVFWFDEDVPVDMNNQPTQSHRLYRLFAFLETPDRAAGVSQRGRIPGKVNLNTLWDFEVFAALCDRNPSNTFTDQDVVLAWRALLALRNPGLLTNQMNPLDPSILGGTLTANDRPLLGMDTGLIPPNDPASPTGRSLDDTIFRRVKTNAPMDSQRLFQTGAAHPHLRNELINKIANSVTTRSNVFAVWLTTGFFEVVDHPTLKDPRDPTGNTPLAVLGEEIGRSDGREIRYRFFSIVDRTQLVVAPQLTSGRGTAGNGDINPNGQAQWVTVTAKKPLIDPLTGQPLLNAMGQPVFEPLNGLNGTVTYNGSTTPVPWQIVPRSADKPGSLLVIDRGTGNEEVVEVLAVDTTNPLALKFQAVFRREHCWFNSLMSITMHGNPGPQPNWDPYSAGESLVVPYWEQLN